MKKTFIRGVDRIFGAAARSAFRNFLAQPVFALNYTVEIAGGSDALSCTAGSIVVANHFSMAGRRA